MKHTIRFERHEHEVINAIRTSVRNSTVVMPLPIVNLVKSIPEWLYPFVEVIDGHIICERVVAPNQSVEDWTKVDVRDVTNHWLRPWYHYWPLRPQWLGVT